MGIWFLREKYLDWAFASSSNTSDEADKILGEISLWIPWKAISSRYQLDACEEEFELIKENLSLATFPESSLIKILFSEKLFPTEECDSDKAFQEIPPSKEYSMLAIE